MRQVTKLVCLLLGALVFAASWQETSAQTVAIKREAISPRLRTGSGWQISTGLPLVAKGMTVFLSAQTTGNVTSLNWSIVSKPGGSAAAIDTPSNTLVRFVPDIVGLYVVQVTANGSINALDTILANTFSGQPLTGGGCAQCHGGSIPGIPDKFTPWKQTAHATILSRGISGQLEVEGTLGAGVYSTSCPRCHTVGHEPNVDNGNFGFRAHQGTPTVPAWDTTWYKFYTYFNGEYLIPYNDSSALNQLNTTYPQLVPYANIGCENCHGPGGDHSVKRASLDAGVCNQCHDAPGKHRIGTYWAASAHAVFPEGGHTGRTSCYPCHSGAAFVKWVKNNHDSTGIYRASDAGVNISCSVCHEPHGNGNPNQLRTMTLDSLRNGYIPPASVGGKGRLCMNCHNARYSVKYRVTTTPPYYGFANNYGPHGNPQADMYFGSNGYQYGDNLLTGQRTHGGVENSCVSCHMAERVNGSSIQSNHELNMTDAQGNDFVTACRECHGADVNSFEDIMAFSDYDQDGTIDPVTVEIEGLLSRLRAMLPTDSTTGEPVNQMRDSLRVKNRPDLIQGIWNYYFVKNDKSLGIHNTKYAVALLQKSIGIYPTDVKPADGQLPIEFALKQNYPNPFNPSTTISFSIPEGSQVRLEVYDMLGRFVTALVHQDMTPGNYSVTWNGTDRFGAQVSSGMYLYRITAGSNVMTRKMLLLK